MRKRNEQYNDYISRLFPQPDTTQAANITIQLTDNCNLNCSYCYQINKGTHTITPEIGKRYIDMVLDNELSDYIDYSKAEGVILEFIGGEPLLEIELMDIFTDYFIKGMLRRDHRWLNRFRISISSNGTLYFDEKFQEYLKKNKHHLSYSISIDGNKKLHDSCRVFPDGSGSYDIAMKAVRHYIDVVGGSMGSKMTLAPENIQYTGEAVKGLIDAGYDDINLNCVYEEGWNNDHAAIFYEQLKKLADYLVESKQCEKVYISVFEESLDETKTEEDNQNWCGGDGQMLSVDWRGDIYPCIRYMESSLGDSVEPYLIGNVWDGVMKTPEQIKKVKCLQCITRRSQSTDECFYCPIAEGCAWCTAYNFQEFGTPDKRATYICCMHIARVLSNVYYWNKTYRKQDIGKRFKNNVPKEWALQIISEEEYENLLKMSR